MFLVFIMVYHVYFPPAKLVIKDKNQTFFHNNKNNNRKKSRLTPFGVGLVSFFTSLR